MRREGYGKYLGLGGDAHFWGKEVTSRRSESRGKGNVFWGDPGARKIRELRTSLGGGGRGQKRERR